MWTSLIRSKGRRLVLLAGLGGGALVLAIVSAVGLGGQTSSHSGSRGDYAGSEPPPRMEFPAFDLHSYRGGSVASSDLRGSVVVLTLLDSQCTDACPLLAWNIARAVESLTAEERDQVRALGLSVDPAEDTPTSVRSFLRRQRAEGRMDYLLGTETEFRLVWDAMRILPSLDTGQDALHSAPLRIYDRDGTWVSTLHAGADLTETNLLHDIRRALSASTRK